MLLLKCISIVLKERIHIMKKAFSLLVCIVLIVAALCNTVPASAEKYDFSVSVNEVTAIPGDSVIFNIDIADNPGIMALTITLHYDPEVLEYETYYAGKLKKDTFAPHDGYVSIVYCGSGNFKGNGTLYSVQFKVKDTAKVGFYPVKVKHIRPAQYGDSLKGCFANSDTSIDYNPQSIAGGISVGYNGENCDHKFGAWENIVEALCKQEGKRTHSCTLCGHTTQETVDKLGHEYSKEWTIDIAASKGQDGEMSRHCIRCDAKTDVVIFTLSDSEENDFSNSEGDQVKTEDWDELEEVVTEPQPEEDKDDGTELDGNTDIKLPTAQELISKTETEEKGFLVSVYAYFFGDGEQKGIFSIIYSGFLKAMKSFLII